MRLWVLVIVLVALTGCRGLALMDQADTSHLRLVISRSPEMLAPEVAVTPEGGLAAFAKALPAFIWPVAGIIQPWAFAAYAVGHIADAANLGAATAGKNDVLVLDAVATGGIEVEWGDKTLTPTKLTIKQAERPPPEGE